MIHVAPCSCELHQALREALARAEKAERERDEWRAKWAREEALGAKDRARVAELEAHCCVKTRSGEYWARQDVCRFVNGECVEHWEPEREAD